MELFKGSVGCSNESVSTSLFQQKVAHRDEKRGVETTPDVSIENYVQPKTARNLDSFLSILDPEADEIVNETAIVNEIIDSWKKQEQKI